MKDRRDPVALGRDLLKKPRENVLQLAKRLSKARADGGFREYCANIGIGRRRAYYLAEVMDAIKEGKLSTHDITSLGWTKCQLIVGAGKPPTQVGRLIRYARDHTTKELAQHLKPAPGDNTITVTFRVTKSEERRMRDFLRELRRVDRSHG